MKDDCSSCQVYKADVLLEGKPLCSDCAKPIEMSSIGFRCGCGLVATVEYESWTCGDNLNYHCPACGQYYKKAIRIKDEQRV